MYRELSQMDYIAASEGLLRNSWRHRSHDIERFFNYQKANQFKLNVQVKDKDKI